MAMLLSNFLATLAIGRPAGAALRPIDNKQSRPGSGAAEPALPDLSLTGHLLLPIVFFTTSLLTIQFALMSYLIAVVWPTNAMVLVAALRHRRALRNTIPILAYGSLASTVAGIALGNSLALGLTLLAANMAEIVLALLLLSAFRIGAANLTSFKNLLIFIGFAGGLAPLASTAISAFAFGWSHGLPWLMVWRNWYPGHALGMIIVAPFLISLARPEIEALNLRRRIPELAAVVGVIVLIGAASVFFRPVIFILAVAILFVTVRFGMIGATTTTLITAMLGSIFVVFGIGRPLLFEPDLSERIFALQAFLAVTAFWSLPTAALLTERDRLLRDLSVANSQLMAESESKSHLVVGLRRHLSVAEERERLRLSHELHDQAGQSLIAAILEVNDIDRFIDAAAQERLHRVRKKMEEMGKTLHRIAWELRPPSIDELGLRKALASYIAAWGEQCATEVDFHCDDPSLDKIPNEIATAIYRVVQEGLTNIVKHANRPSNVSVVIRRRDMTLQVIIEDNGAGFDMGTAGARSGRTGGRAANYRGLGLAGMRERLALIGGTLDIESAPDAGTTIFARIALEDVPDDPAPDCDSDSTPIKC